MPLVDAAVRRLTFEINDAKRKKLSGLKIIHGYGSSGTGGRIRTEVRSYLTRLAARGEIKSFITGEALSIFDEGTRTAFGSLPELRKDSDLERHNNGITVIVL